MPSISIITICKNSEKTIEKTILSVIQQKRSEDEYIVIDGGSTDSTVEIIEKYAAKIDLYISEPDKGIADAFNKGIENSRCEIISLLNSDDQYLEGTLDAVVNAYKDSPGNYVVFGDTYIEKNQKTYMLKKRKISLCYTIPFSHCAMFVPKELYEIHGIYSLNYKYAMDIDLILKFYKSKIPFIFKKDVRCLKGVSGITQKHRIKAFYDYFLASKKYNGFFCSAFFLGLKIFWHYFSKIKKYYGTNI